jgi:hypothetical protein
MLLAMDFEPSSFLKLLLVGAVTTTLMLRLYLTRRKQQLLARQQTRTGQPRAQTEPGVASHLPHETMRLQAEIFDFTRDVQARLDNKIAMLQQLLSAADERISRLTALEAERLGGSMRGDTNLTFAPADDGGGGDPYERDSARYAVVYGMADAGHSANAIARRLEIALGEVELMLSLRRRLPERRTA